MRTVDVVVVGAGPAGSAAAITLARAGRDVVVVDKATFPRDKVCGDGLTTSALRRLEQLGLRPETVPSWHRIDDVIVRSPSGRTVTLPLPRHRGTFAAVARRADLDHALVQLARDAGATTYEGCALERVEPRGDGVVVRAGGRELRAAHVVGADGMWSPLRKALGVARPGYLGEWHAVRQYVRASRAGHELHVWFEPELLPGYAWSFPLPDGTVNVGFGITRDGPIRTKEMRSLWPKLLARPHIRAVLGDETRPENPLRAWPIPARIDDVVLSCGPALFVGDAAAATDPMTGEGIGQALLTGMLAAEAITRHTHDPASAAAAYERAVRRHLVADHRMSMWLMEVLRRERLARGAIRIAGATPWIRRNFARWLFEDEPRAVVLTPRRWHRGFLAREGAFAG
ncbi:MAG TPA: geranylgeranyl reductase family protein [Acidimicrobiales bacterium]